MLLSKQTSESDLLAATNAIVKDEQMKQVAWRSIAGFIHTALAVLPLPLTGKAPSASKEADK